MELFDERVVLFESDEEGERLLVTCEPSGHGRLGGAADERGPVNEMVL